MRFSSAFPSRLAADVLAVAATMPGTRLPSASPFPVDVRGETVWLPTRIYHPEPAAGAAATFTATQRTILHCLYSRHHDGWVRQRHLEQIVASTEPWVVPFVVQPAGEYVLEIIEAIARGLPADRGVHGDFLVRNPEFLVRTERRIVSYWTCYYRRWHPDFASYPGGALISVFQAAAEEAGLRWRRQTPRAAAGPRNPA